MPSDFNQRIDRRGTNCAKWDEMDEKCGCQDIIWLGVADMDFQSPEEIRRAFAEIVEHGIFGYTNLSEGFYTAISNWLKEQTGEDIPKEWMIYCPRINISSSLLVDALTQKNESILLHTPHYMPLYHAISKNGRKVIESPLKWNSGRYEMDFEQMEAAVEETTKMLLLCNPHNPCTTVFQKDEMDKLAQFCIRHDLILVSDEIHSDILKQGVTFTSSLKYAQVLKERMIYVNSPTKTFNIPGIILSYMIVPNERIRGRIKQEIDRIGMHNPNVFANAAVETGYSKCGDWLAGCRSYIDENEIYIREYMEQNLPGFLVMPREGTYLLWIDCRSFGISDEALEQWFIYQARVGVYMGTVFGAAGSGFIRMNIAAPRELIKEALLQMTKAYKMLGQKEKENLL